MAMLTQEVRDLWAAGLKVKAIKRYRVETGAGLKESKRLVEAMCADIGVDGGLASETTQPFKIWIPLCRMRQSLRFRFSQPQVVSSEVPVLGLVAKDHPIWDALTGLAFP